MKESSVSPKTPGGISKSLLTPCRRLGLSRKWRKSSCSPFISPLSTKNSTPEGNEGRMTRKRKNCEMNEEVSDETSVINCEQLSECESNNTPPIINDYSHTNTVLNTTPCRNTQIPRKRSKTLLPLKGSKENEKELSNSNNTLINNKTTEVIQTKPSKDDTYVQNDVSPNNNSELTNDKVLTPVKQSSQQNLSKPVRSASKRNKQDSDEGISKPVRTESSKIERQHSVDNVTKPAKTESKTNKIKCSDEHVTKPVKTESKSKNKLSLKRSKSKSSCITETKETECVSASEVQKPKEISPNKLTKECIVVIQNKILKTATNKIVNDNVVISQGSDSDPDIPLSILKTESTENVTLNTLNDDDFINKPVKKKLRNLSILKPLETKRKSFESCNSSPNSQDNVDNRTILVKKTYEKVIKPSKAKSTGSITQKDIDDLKARIEMKKKLLMSKAISKDTEELRSLIKKWQKGCQDALMELLDLMKKKLPDQRNMDYAEMLQALKIPPDLVGYDIDNDCFVTPDDANVLLTSFNI